MKQHITLIIFLCVAACAAFSTPAAELAPDVLDWMRVGYTLDETEPVIIQLTEPLSDSEREFLFSGATPDQEFEQLNMLVIHLRARDLPRWAAHDKVKAISLDRMIELLAADDDSDDDSSDDESSDDESSDDSSSDEDHDSADDNLLRNATGAERVRKAYRFDGDGVTVAVFDSGIDTSEVNTSNFSYGADDLDPMVDDHGHGTHVAGIIAGNGYTSSAYEGIAPGAEILPVRVLDAAGQGQVSDVLYGVDMILSSSAKNKVRVVNMSFGSASSETWRTDPMCSAIKLLYDEDITTVTSAGNIGKKKGERVYGSITSPGNCPFAITVGALNNKNTESRLDDKVAGFSSAGPTRQYDELRGQYDNLLKPELVAPGVQIISTQAEASALAELHPDLKVKLIGKPDRYMKLSGTSMSAAAVSGAVALMYDANKHLSPAVVRGTLMYTAQTLPDYDVFEQGAGSLNIEGAVRMARAMNSGRMSKRSRGSAILKAKDMPATYSMYGTERIEWSAGRVMIPDGEGGQVEAGGLLFTEGIVFCEGVLFVEQVLFAEGLIFTEGVLFVEHVVNGKSLLFTEDGLRLTKDKALDASSLLFTESVPLAHGNLLNDEMIMFAEGVLYTEGLLFVEDVSDTLKAEDFALDAQFNELFGASVKVMDSDDLSSAKPSAEVSTIIE